MKTRLLVLVEPFVKTHKNFLLVKDLFFVLIILKRNKEIVGVKVEKTFPFNRMINM